jgi:TPR repeat protein
MLAVALLSASSAMARDYEDAIAALSRNDSSTASQLLRPSAEQGDALAQIALVASSANLGAETFNFKEIVTWVRRAADQDVAAQRTLERKAGVVAAQLALGSWYAHGNEEIAQNLAEAVIWFGKAADQGNVSGLFELAQMYRSGTGVAQDYGEAAKWFHEAAEHDIPKWFREAMEHNLVSKYTPDVASAQFMLGSMYEDGDGVPQDIVLAHMWYNISAAHGSSDAAHARRRLERDLTPEQVAEAQRLTREWKPTK